MGAVVILLERDRIGKLSIMIQKFFYKRPWVSLVGLIPYGVIWLLILLSLFGIKHSVSDDAGTFFYRFTYYFSVFFAVPFAILSFFLGFVAKENRARSWPFFLIFVIYTLIIIFSCGYKFVDQRAQNAAVEQPFRY